VLTDSWNPIAAIGFHVTDYVKITEEAGCVVCVCIWYCGSDINDTLHGSQGGGKGEKYQMHGWLL